jgi:hypothetical protein
MDMLSDEAFYDESLVPIDIQISGHVDPRFDVRFDDDFYEVVEPYFFSAISNDGSQENDLKIFVETLKQSIQTFNSSSLRKLGARLVSDRKLLDGSSLPDRFPGTEYPEPLQKALISAVRHNRDFIGSRLPMAFDDHYDMFEIADGGRMALASSGAEVSLGDSQAPVRLNDFTGGTLSESSGMQDAAYLLDLERALNLFLRNFAQLENPDKVIVRHAAGLAGNHSERDSLIKAEGVVFKDQLTLETPDVLSRDSVGAHEPGQAYVYFIDTEHFKSDPDKYAWLMAEAVVVGNNIRVFGAKPVMDTDKAETLPLTAMYVLAGLAGLAEADTLTQFELDTRPLRRLLGMKGSGSDAVKALRVNFNFSLASNDEGSTRFALTSIAKRVLISTAFAAAQLAARLVGSSA